VTETTSPAPLPPELPSAQTRVCQNCGAPLAGEFCAACGQRHEPHVHTMRHFAAEAFESVTHADSRLWRTLWYLVSRPGFLTQEFFAGRRVSFLPPFRLYLVVSVIFFLVGMPHEARVGTDSRTTAAAAAVKHSKDSARKRTEANAALDAVNDPDGKGVRVRMSGVDYFCREFVDQPDSTNSARNHLRDNCRRLQEDDGRALGAAMLHNLPRAMFVFLPLLALIMWLLYWRPKRYYVEHLLLLLHNHAFVFIAGSVIALVALIPGLEAYGVADGFMAVVLLYMAWYLYRSMRVYYTQGRALTLAKYVFLTLTYTVLSLVMLLLTLLFSAMTM
jgi:hypothetical protein